MAAVQQAPSSDCEQEKEEEPLLKGEAEERKARERARKRARERATRRETEIAKSGSGTVL